MALAVRPLPTAARGRILRRAPSARRGRAGRARVAPAAALGADMLDAAVSVGGSVLDVALGGVLPAWGAEAEAAAAPFGLSTETLSFLLAASGSLGFPLAFAATRQSRCALSAPRFVLTAFSGHAQSRMQR